MKKEIKINIHKKILLIAYSFPPIISAQSLRWFYLSRELIRKGYNVDVLTVKMPERFQGMLDLIPKGISIYRTFPGFFYYLTFKYSRASSNQGSSGSSASPFSLLWKSLTAVHLKIYNVLNALFVPDISSEWLLFAIRKGLKLSRMNKYDIIISESFPGVCHIIGYILKKKKSNIRWIADYGDPWVSPIPTLYEPEIKRKVIRHVERFLLKKMDTIIVTTDKTRQSYLRNYPFIPQSKIHVIPQGFSQDMFANVKEEAASKFRIVYCGSMYKNLRDPMAVFNAIKDIDKNVEVIVAGVIGEYIDILRGADFREKVKYMGFLNHQEALSLQKSATILLHIGNATEIQVPGKIYEYFGSGKPIMVVKSLRDDESASMVLKYNRGIVVDNKIEEIKKGILMLYELWQKGNLDTRFTSNLIEEFTWGKRAEMLSNIIENTLI